MGPVHSETKQSKIKYLFIQMECCEQETLKEFIDSGKLKNNENLFYRLLNQILEAFTYIHDRQMIHRDIKPPNIFLDKKLNIKLGDFGLATRTGLLTEIAPNAQDEDSQEEAGVGTPLYMSPEQKTGAKCTCAADMYSLGIVIFEMVYGPFSTGSERIPAIIALREQLKLPADFDKRAGTLAPVCRDLILRLVETNPNKRPTSKEVLSKLQDQLYEEMMDSNEYTKLIKFLFSDKNNFTDKKSLNSDEDQLPMHNEILDM